jgi:hypothetical protein
MAKLEAQVCCAGWMMYGQKTLLHCIHVWEPTMVIKYVLMCLPSTCINLPSSHQVACLFIYLVTTYIASYPGWGRREAGGLGSQLWFIQSCVITGFQWMGQWWVLCHIMLCRPPKNELRKESGIYAEPISEKKRHWLQADVRNSSFSHVVHTSEAHAQKEFWSSLSVWKYGVIIAHCP